MRDENPNPCWQEINKALREVLSKEINPTLRDQIAAEVESKERRQPKSKKQARSNKALNQARIQKATERIRDKELKHQQRKNAFDTYMINKYLA